MYRLEKRFRFEASHVLRRHDGKCARLHGHSWHGVVVLEGEELQTDGPKKGMLVDFGDVGLDLDGIVRLLDHYHLNEVLDTDSPTSEFVARWVYERLKPLQPLLAEVRIEETCTSACTYRPTSARPHDSASKGGPWTAELGGTHV
jgi:6-pyruvoyltetrahydropterin/6-carboxytetrahydropterin synthase